MADSLSKKQRITVCALSDGGAMEGEAREALASIPGLAKNRKLERFILVISDNNTKLSGRIDEDSFSMEPTFRSLDPLGWKMIELQEGNDLQKCLSAFEKAVQWVEENPHVPVVILAKTVKGFGVKSTMSSASGGHGFPVKKPQELSEFLKEIYIGENVPSEFMNWCEEMVLEYNDKNQSSNSNQTEKFPTEKVQVGITKALINMRKKGYPVISITSDLPDSTGVGGFRKEFKSEQIDVGIAESNMISVAIGLSKEGYIPVVDTFAQFGVTKGALPLIMSALSQGPVIAIFSHAGFQDAADGASHQALSYFAMTHSIPYTDTYMLSCSGEAEMLVTQAIEEFANAKKQGKVPHSKIFFLGRENFPRWMQTENENYKLGKSFLVFDNTSEFSKSIIIAATGPMVFNSLAAAKELGRQNVGCAIINPIAINRVDTELFESILPRVNGRLLTVEDHQVVGGMGAVLVHELSQKGLIKKVRSLGVKNHFGQSAYTADELYKMHGLDSASIFAAALDMMT
jgi:transketolase